MPRLSARRQRDYIVVVEWCQGHGFAWQALIGVVKGSPIVDLLQLVYFGGI